MQKTLQQTPAQKRRTAASMKKASAKKNVKSNPTPTKKVTPNASSKRKRISNQSPATTGRKKRGTGSRYDSSLGLLTRKFLKLLRSATDGSLDLNATAAELDVQKRRIYDITNVLEGIGLLEKKSKNTIMWKGGGTKVTPEKAQQLQELRVKIQAMKDEEKEVDDNILKVAKELNQAAENPAYSKLAYATSQDLQSLPSFKNERVLAIRAPMGTTLEVPDPYDNSLEAGKRVYQIFLKSPQGAIDVFLVNTDNSQNQQGFNADQGDTNDNKKNNSSSGGTKNSNSNNNSKSRLKTTSKKNNDMAISFPSPMYGQKKGGNMNTIEFSPSNDFIPSGHLVKLSPLPVGEDYNFSLDDGDTVADFFI